MARPKNNVETVQVTMAATKKVRAYLELLTEDGLHGKSVAETAYILVAERIKELVRSGHLPASSEIATDD